MIHAEDRNLYFFSLVLRFQLSLPFWAACDLEGLSRPVPSPPPRPPSAFLVGFSSRIAFCTAARRLSSNFAFLCSCGSVLATKKKKTVSKFVEALFYQDSSSEVPSTGTLVSPAQPLGRWVILHRALLADNKMAGIPWEDLRRATDSHCCDDVPTALCSAWLARAAAPYYRLRDRSQDIFARTRFFFLHVALIVLFLY